MKKISIYFKQVFQPLSILFLSIYATLIATRISEFLFIDYIHHFDAIWSNFLPALFYDLIGSLIVAAVFLPLAILFRDNKALRILLIDVPIALLLTINITLVFYFSTVLEPLDKVFLQHSVTEMGYVITAFGEFKPVYLFILVIPLIYGLLRYFLKGLKKKKQLVPISIVGLIASILLILIIGASTTPSRGDYDNAKAYYLINNKVSYLLKSVLEEDRFSPRITMDEAISQYQQEMGKNFVSSEFPYLHVPEQKSTISPFFDLKAEKPPNFVFIMVESLSSAFSGKHAQELSFTPFLDSLSNQSLTFHNFLSNGERTFSVMPSSFGSLPHGRKGFTNEGYKMPYHNTIHSNLGRNGYQGAFFYGGYAHYSFYDTFMERQGTKYIYEQSDYNYEGTGKTLSVDDVPFGVDDLELFEMALKALDTIGHETPYIHTYLTLTMHYPFRFKGQEAYLKNVSSIIEKADFGDDIKSKFRKYKKILSTIMYTDNSLREFMNEYKNREEFDNTIFLFYGDHRISGIPSRDPLDIYHVPLIIYSPLLNQSKDFYALNSHLDIPPSLDALMESEYNLELPDTVHWIGEQLDTSATFRSSRKFPIMLNNRNVEQYIYNDYFYSFDRLYSIQSDLSLKEVDDKNQKSKIRSFIAVDKLVASYATQNNKILHPSAADTRQKSILAIDEQGTFEFGQNTEYEMLLRHDFKEDYSEISIDLDLPWLTNFDDVEEGSLPLLVVVIKQQDGESFWSGYKINEMIFFEEESHPNLKLSQLIHENNDVRLDKGNEIAVYFWNNSKPEETFKYKKKRIRLNGIGE